MRASRIFAIVGVVVVVSAFVVIAGTLFESRWTGEFGPCSRPLDTDGSTFQEGKASVELLPPRIHCSFASVPGSTFPAPLRAATDNRVAYFGIAIVGMVVTGVLLMFGLIRWVKADGRAEIPI